MDDAAARRRNHWVNHIARHAHEKPLTLDELREWGAGRLARYKLPTMLHVVAALPRNASGKVMKTVLRGTFGDLG